MSEGGMSLVPEAIRDAIKAENDVECLRRAATIVHTAMRDEGLVIRTRKSLGIKSAPSLLKRSIETSDLLRVLANHMADDAVRRTEDVQNLRGER